jgi:membrane-associated phospholipid phosphatase
MSQYISRYAVLFNGCRAFIASTFLVAVLLLCVRTGNAEEISFTGEVSGFSSRLLGEGADFVTTPFSVKDGNLFWTLGIAGAIGLTYAVDGDINKKLQGGVRGRTMDKITNVGELIGNPYLHIGVAALVYSGGIAAENRNWKEAGEMMAEAIALADVATLLIKEGTGRGRPVATDHKGDFKPMQFKNDYDSLPSMHTASSFAMASVLARTSDSIPVAVMSYTAATFVGFSRMYQNKHWASDVLLGAAIGELAGRVVTSYHASKGSKLVVLPGVSGDSVSMNVLYRF